MILWTFKLYTTIRRAIAGRRYPYQLAWAVAFGFLLGVIPHGNLLAVGLLIVVLSLKLNHAMAGLTAVAVSFLATKLDPYSHDIGNYVLTHPEVTEVALNAWAVPMMPWTSLNNTIVMGSFVIGLTSLVPIFMVTYPIFRWLAPQDAPDQALSDQDADSDTSALSVVKLADVRSGQKHQVLVVDTPHDRIPSPMRFGQPTSGKATVAHPQSQSSDERIEFVELVDNGLSEPPQSRVAVETRIDVIRMRVSEHPSPTPPESPSGHPTDPSEPQPMDEALNYLLRQLRDSQQRKAA